MMAFEKKYSKAIFFIFFVTFYNFAGLISIE